MAGSCSLLAKGILIPIILPHPDFAPRFAADKALKASLAEHFTPDWNAASGLRASARHSKPHQPKWECRAQRGRRLRHKADATRPQGLKNRVEGSLTVGQDEKESRCHNSIDCAGELLQALRICS